MSRLMLATDDAPGRTAEEIVADMLNTLANETLRIDVALLARKLADNIENGEG